MFWGCILALEPIQATKHKQKTQHVGTVSYWAPSWGNVQLQPNCNPTGNQTTCVSSHIWNLFPLWLWGSSHGSISHFANCSTTHSISRPSQRQHFVWDLQFWKETQGEHSAPPLMLRVLETWRHWGQRGSYLVGTLRVCWEFLNNLPTLDPVGKWWANSQCTHQFGLDGVSE